MNFLIFTKKFLVFLLALILQSTNICTSVYTYVCVCVFQVGVFVVLHNRNAVRAALCRSGASRPYAAVSLQRRSSKQRRRREEGWEGSKVRGLLVSLLIELVICNANICINWTILQPRIERSRDLSLSPSLSLCISVSLAPLMRKGISIVFKDIKRKRSRRRRRAGHPQCSKVKPS